MKKIVNMVLGGLLILSIAVLGKTDRVSAAPLQFRNAKEIVFEEEYKATLPAFSGDSNNLSEHIYKVNMEKSGKLEIYTENSYDYRFFDADGNKIDTIFTGGNDCDYTIYLKEGEYYIGFLNNTHENPVSFNVICAASYTEESFPENAEKNDDEFSRANEISFDTEYKGQFGENDTHDNFKFTIPAEGNVTFTLDVKAVQGNGTPTFTLYDSDFKSIKTEHIWTSEGKTSSEVTYSLKAGSYYMDVLNEFAVANRNPGYAYTVKFTYKVTAKPAATTAKRSGKKIKVDFDKVEGAKEYQITYSTNKKFTKKTTKTVKVKKNTGSVKNVNKGKTYYTKVRALVEIDGKIYYGPYTKANKIK
jgi:hypothetical protein